MAFRTKVKKKEDHLHFEIEGDFEMAGLDVVIDQLFEEVVLTQSPRVLMNVRGLTGSPSVWERFQFSTLFAASYLKARALGSIPSCRFAVFGEEPMVDPKRFGEKVANNRGVMLRVFTSETEALEWLLKD